MSQNLVLMPGSLPSGWCPTNWQEAYNKFFALGSALLPAGVGLALKVDAGPRTVDDQGNVIWLNTTTGHLLRYDLGAWIARHPLAASGNERMIVALGSEADVWAMDGGDGTDPSVTAPTDTTGAMWEVDHTFDFRFPVGVGTNPATSTTIPIEGTGGLEQVTLTTAEGAQDANHKHTVGRQVDVSGSKGDDVALLTGSNVATGAGFVVHGDSSYESKNIEDCDGAYAVTSGVTMSAITAHTNMPPYIGVWFVKRTARVYFTS